MPRELQGGRLSCGGWSRSPIGSFGWMCSQQPAPQPCGVSRFRCLSPVQPPVGYSPSWHYLKQKIYPTEPSCLSLFRLLQQKNRVVYKQQKYFSYSFGGQEVQDQGKIDLGVWWGPAPCFTEGHLAVSSQVKGQGSSLGALIKDHRPIHENSVLMT